MGFFYWGKHKPNGPGPDWELRAVRVDDLRPSHGLGSGDRERVDRIRRGGRGAGLPITVDRGRITDGHARVAVAKERGQATIQAWVRQ